MISSNALQEFLTDPTFEFEVIEPEDKDIWDIIVEYTITEDRLDELHASSAEVSQGA
jgi:hypothetical protein